MSERLVRVGHDLVRSRGRVGFLYRESNPEADEGDTGWRVFSSVEDLSSADDPDLFGFYPLSVVVEIDPAIEPLLDSPPYAAYCRGEGEDTFVPVLDFPVEPD